jgi:hypothetical protein
VRVNGDETVRTSSNNFNFFPDRLDASHGSRNIVVSSHAESRSRVVEADVILCFVELVSGEDRDADAVLLLLKGSESSGDSCLLIGEEDGPHGVENYLRSVFVGDSPLVFNRNSRVVLNAEFLFGTDSEVGGREEDRVGGEADARPVAGSVQGEGLDVGCRVIEDELLGETVVSSALRAELNTDEGKALSRKHA